jgi:hypothetical protein
LNSRGTNPIGLAGQRLNHSAKVSFAQTYRNHFLINEMSSIANSIV